MGLQEEGRVTCCWWTGVTVFLLEVSMSMIMVVPKSRPTVVVVCRVP